MNRRCFFCADIGAFYDLLLGAAEVLSRRENVWERVTFVIFNEVDDEEVSCCTHITDMRNDRHL